MPGFREAYEADTSVLAVTRVRVILVLGFIMYPMVTFLDFAIYPDVAPNFLTLRIIFATIAFLGWFLSFTKWGARNVFGILFFGGLYGDLAVSLMIAQVDGWSSLYFVGNMLTTMGVIYFVPWSPRVTLLYCFSGILGYFLINLQVHPASPEMLIPFTFLSINLVLLTFSSMGSEVSRMGMIAQRLDIEKAHQELKRLDEAKARFFANISHELRTPLTLIIGPLTAATKNGGQISSDLIDSMTSNAQRLLRQVNALLDLGKVDSDKMTLSLDVGNLGAMATDLYKAAAPGAKERGIELVLNVAVDLPDSRFDFEKVETIVANLISNAIKFTPVGGKVIISARLENSVFHLSVKDTGAGIPKDQFAKMFARFHQVEDSAKKASKGTGLGLSVAKEFAELHGGKIWFESEVGKGTEFFVDLPLMEVVDTSVGPKLSESETKIRNEARSTLLVDITASEGSEFLDTHLLEENQRRYEAKTKSKPVILYVDDNRDLRRYVDGILSESYTLLLAQDGEQGFEQALKFEPDLILSDVMMPKVDGFELCQKVRGDAKLKSTPFVLLTANSSLDSKIAGLKDGADDYLGKPFSEQELVARIKNLVRLRQQATMIKKQINAAKDIQAALLPPFSQNLQGVKVDAIYEPSEELSGDFFDTTQVGKWVYAYVADVTGHGIAAAQVTYLVKQIFKQALTSELKLSALFDVVRKSYVEHKLDYDLGLQLLRVNSETGATEFLRSNAPDPFLISEDSTVKRLEAPISPLISFQHSDVEKPAQVLEVNLAKGQSLYLYSDGAYEFEQATGDEFGLRRLGQSLAQTHRMEWPKALHQRLQTENREAFFPDDLTILRVSR